MREPFVVMAKPVGSRCNLNCAYCYYLGTDGRIGNGTAPVMDDEILEAFVRSYIAASPGPAIQFTWHGGEPALAGLDFYRRAVALQKQYLPAGWQCWNNLQTNGVLLDEAWCDFLAEEHFDVGISIDGTAALHDRYRKDAVGGGTYERVRSAVERLMARGIKPDLLCTVTADAAREPEGVYTALRDLGTGWMQFIPIVRWGEGGVPTADSVSPRAYGDFLSAVFQRWITHDLGRTWVQFFAECAQVLAGGQASLCWMAPTCGRVPVVEREGGVFSCDHDVDMAHFLGNLKEDDLGELVDSPAQRVFGEAKKDLTAQCRACPYLVLCNGGCPRDRFGTSAEGEKGQYFLCEGLLAFFRRSYDRLALLGEGLRRRKSPGEIMAAAKALEQKKWKGVGRNDPCPCGSGKKAKDCCWDLRP